MQDVMNTLSMSLENVTINDINENDCNWTTAEFHQLHLSSSAVTKDSAVTKQIDCVGISSEIVAKASSMFDME